MKATAKVFEPLAVNGDGTACHIGDRLREIRKLAGLTQADVADRLQIGQSAVTRLEGRKDIHLSTLREYLGAVGATLRVHAQFETEMMLVNNLREARHQFDQADENQLLLPIISDDFAPLQKDVVFSIKPEYCRKIVNGEKTVELRRRFPISVPTGTTALIYETSPTRALSGIAEITAVHKQTPSEVWRTFSERACISRKQFDEYFKGVDSAFAIELRRARPLRRLFGLSELRERFGFEPPQSFLYATPQLREAIRYERA